MDDILRFEMLTLELPEYLLRLGIDIQAEEIPRMGASGIRSYRSFYDDSTQRFVTSFYQYEIERFGYSFDELP